MAFFRTVKDSIYGPEFYAAHNERTLATAWGYYTKLAVIGALIFTLVFALFTIPPLNRFLAQVPDQVMSVYPDELALIFENNTVRSNVPEPYFIAIPPQWKNEMSKTDAPSIEHLLVIDTQQSFSAEKFREYRAGAWLFRDGVAMIDNRGFRVQMFAEISNQEAGQVAFILNENVIRNFIDRLAPMLRFVPAILVTVLFFGLLILYGLSLFYLAFSALFALLLGKILKKNWSYADSLKLTFFATTLPFLLYHILLPFTPLFGPLVYTSVILLVLIVNFGWDNPPAPVQTPKQPSVTPPEDESNKPAA